MDKQQYFLSFENGSVADANRWARELKEFVLDAATSVTVEQQRDNPYSMDFGSTLVLTLGTPAVIAVATAVGKWLALHRQVGITIKTADGECIGENLTSKDAMKLAELFLTHEK